jgi:small subunit ribosomal protein S18
MSDEDNREEGGLLSSPYHRKRRICAFCVEKVNKIDYKQHEVLRRYLTEHGRIRPRRQTGTCAKHQRSLALAVKRARHLALLPFVVD